MTPDDAAVGSGTAISADNPVNLTDPPTLTGLLQRAQAQGLSRLDAQLLLARATGLTRTVLLADGEQPVAAATQQQFERECLRRLEGEPLAYIEGCKEFWSLALQVNSAVLVPRPETELLVERTLALLPPQPLQVADLGTGSGAIALALAHERPQWSVLGVDRSTAALNVARDNAQRLALDNVDWRCGHWCEPLAGSLYDAIVSNPPYVAADDPALAALRHEPLSALAASDDGYGDLLAIIDEARQHLQPGGWLLLEHGTSQADRLTEALVAAGYARVVCHPDLAGHPRVTEACWPGC